MSETSVPNDVRVRPEADQTAVGSVANNDEEALPTVVLVLALTEAVPAVTAEPREEEAVSMVLLVLALTTAAIDEEAVPIAVLVLPLTTAAIDEDAVDTSLWSASAPASRPAPVKVRVVLFQTSATRVPNEVRVLPE